MLSTAVFTAEDLDQAYADGREDLATKLIELIRQADFEISSHTIAQFVESEIGYSEDAARWTRVPDRSSIPEYDPDDRSRL